MYGNPSIMVEFDPVLLLTSIKQTNWLVQTINTIMFLMSGNLTGLCLNIYFFNQFTLFNKPHFKNSSYNHQSCLNRTLKLNLLGHVGVVDLYFGGELKKLWHVVQEGEDNDWDHKRFGGVHMPEKVNKTY